MNLWTESNQSNAMIIKDGGQQWIYLNIEVNLNKKEILSYRTECKYYKSQYCRNNDKITTDVRRRQQQVCWFPLLFLEIVHAFVFWKYFLTALGLGCKMRDLLVVACGIFSRSMQTQLEHVKSSSLTRDWTRAPLHWKQGVLATGPPGKYPISSSLILEAIWIQSRWTIQNRSTMQ